MLCACSLAERTPEPVALRAAQSAGSGGSTAGAGGVAGGGGPPPPQQTQWLAFPSAPMPTDGVLLVADPIGRQPTLHVFSTDMVEVPGAMEAVEQLRLWRPSRPPLAAGNYLVVYDDGTPTTQLIVEGTHEERAPMLVSEPSASLVTEFIDTSCCYQWDGTRFVGSTLCFGTRQRISIALEPGLSSPEPLSVLSQLAFRMRARGDDTPADAGSSDRPLSIWGGALQLRFTDQADAYCYDLEVLDLVTLETRVLRDITPSCAEHGDLADLGVSEIEPTLAQLDPLVCHAPPPILTEQWCENVDRACEREPSAPGCLQRDICDGGALFVPDGTDLQPAEHDAAVEEAPKPRIVPDGGASLCSASPHPSHARHGATIMLACVVLGVWLRRGWRF